MTSALLIREFLREQSQQAEEDLLAQEEAQRHYEFEMESCYWEEDFFCMPDIGGEG